MASRLGTVAVIAGALVFAATASGGSGGGVIVFSATPQGSPIAQLFSIEASGDGLKQLTTGANAAIDPAFSSDGTRIAFSRTGAGVFTALSDGSRLDRLTKGGRDSYPAWSPNGKSIAFVRPSGAQWRLYVVPSTGGTPHQLSEAPPAGRPSWTKEGLLIPSGGDLLRVDPTTGRVLKYYGANIDALYGLNSVTLSRNVSTLTFVGARAPEPGDMECAEGPCQRFGLYIESLSAKRKRPHLIAKDSGPATFSPDGKQIVSVSGGELELRSLTGAVSARLSTGTAYPTGTAPPAWSIR